METAQLTGAASIFFPICLTQPKLSTGDELGDSASTAAKHDGTRLGS